MSWLIENPLSQTELAHQFQQLMDAPQILKIPGAHNGLTASIARQVGFESLYLSGAAYTASRALPDLGIITSDEVTAQARDLIRAANLPLLVDIDTGFGGVLNAARTAREMVEAGVAAVQMEDQDLPKKCGHLNGKKLISATEMAQKIRAIKQTTPSLLIVARTDAKSVEGIEAAVERANFYMQSGADAIFPEALESEAEFRQFRQSVDAPLLANMTEFGRTPYFSAAQFENWGYQMMIFPVTTLRVAAKACHDVLQQIFQNGTQVDSVDQMMTRQELYQTIGYYEYEKMDAGLAGTVLPDQDGK